MLEAISLDILDFEPTRNRVVVLPEAMDDEIRTKSGIIMAAGDAAQREARKQQYGILIAYGPNAWDDTPETRAMMRLGSRVVFGKYAGITVETQDGTLYRVLNDTDIVMQEKLDAQKPKA